MKAKPTIGISANYIKVDYKEVSCEKNALSPEYVDAVERAGGIPLIIPILDSPAMLKSILKKIDGLVITGGDDINPNRYGEKKHPKTGMLPPRRENHDFMLLDAVIQTKLPVLAICCGVQLVNVVSGGSLYQDILSQCPDSFQHMQKGNQGYHRVKIVPNTLLRSILGKTSILTNSMHHQALKKIGKGLKVSARCEDGIIEAVEMKDKGFFLGIQWHPEEIPDRADHRAIFSALIDAC